MPASVEMREICKTISGQRILDRASFSAAKGTIHGLVGKNGAGKSTLMKVLYGAVAKDSGEILVNGTPCEIGSVAQARALGISMVFQELNLFPKMTVAENITSPNLGRVARHGLIRPRLEERTALGYANRLGFALRHPRQRCATLSGGNQQKTIFGRGLYSGRPPSRPVRVPRIRNQHKQLRT